MTDSVFPFMIQVLREYTQKVDELTREREEQQQGRLMNVVAIEGLERTRTVACAPTRLCAPSWRPYAPVWRPPAILWWRSSSILRRPPSAVPWLTWAERTCVYFLTTTAPLCLTLLSCSAAHIAYPAERL